MFARAALVATLLLASIASAASQCRFSSVETAERVVRGKILAGEVARKEEWQSWFKSGSSRRVVYKFTMQVDTVVKGEPTEKTIVVWTELDFMGYGSFGLLTLAVSNASSVELEVEAEEGRLVSKKCTYFRAVE